MSENPAKAAALTTKEPSHVAYQVRDGNQGKAYWNRIGAAWTNRDGSFTVLLDALPLDGRIVLRVPNPQD
jgi:hypothetical protein